MQNVPKNSMRSRPCMSLRQVDFRNLCSGFSQQSSTRYENAKHKYAPRHVRANTPHTHLPFYTETSSVLSSTSSAARQPECRCNDHYCGEDFRPVIAFRVEADNFHKMSATEQYLSYRSLPSSLHREQLCKIRTTTPPRFNSA